MREKSVSPHEKALRRGIAGTNVEGRTAVSAATTHLQYAVEKAAEGTIAIALQRCDGVPAKSTRASAVRWRCWDRHARFRRSEAHLESVPQTWYGFIGQ